MTLTQPSALDEPTDPGADTPVSPTKGSRKSGRNGLSVQRLLMILVGVIIAVFSLGPLVYLVIGTFQNDDTGGYDFGGFTRAYTERPGIGHAFGSSFEFAIGSTVLALVAGSVLAFLHVRSDARLRRLIVPTVLVTFLIPSLLYALSYILLMSPSVGMLNGLVYEVIRVRPFNIYGMWGMVWVQGLHLTPVVFLFMVSAFKGMDPSLEESALVSGATMTRTLRKITTPLLLPGLTSAALIVFVLSLENFEVPGIIGLQKQIYTLSTEIYFSITSEPTDYQGAGALSLSLLVIATIALVISRRVARGYSATISGKGFRPRTIELRRGRTVADIMIVLYFLFAMLLPLLVLVYTSFLPYYRGFSVSEFSSFSLDNYRDVGNIPQIGSSIKNSIIVSVASATAVMFVTTIGSWIVTRTRLRGRQGLDFLAFTPIVVPGIVLGLAVMFVFVNITTLPIYGTLWIFIIAFLSRYLPYGMRFASASLAQISRELEEAAWVSGASWTRTFRKVLLPLSGSGVSAGWVFVFIMSFRELSCVLFLYSPGTEVFPVVIYRAVANQTLGVVSALSIVMLGIIVAVISLVSCFPGVRQALRNQ